MTSFFNRLVTSSRKVNNNKMSINESRVVTEDILRDINHLQMLLQEYKKLLQDVKYWHSQVIHLRNCKSTFSLTVMEMLNSAGFNIYKLSLDDRYKNSRTQLKKAIDELYDFLIKNRCELQNLNIYYEFNPPYVKDNAFYFRLGFLTILFSSVGFSILYSNELDFLKLITSTFSVSLPFYFAIEMLEFQQKHNWYSLYSSIKHKLNDITTKKFEKNLEKVIKRFKREHEEELSVMKSMDKTNQKYENNTNIAQNFNLNYDHNEGDTHVEELPMSIIGLSAAMEWRLESLKNQLKKLSINENPTE